MVICVHYFFACQVVERWSWSPTVKWNSTQVNLGVEATNNRNSLNVLSYYFSFNWISLEASTHKTVTNNRARKISIRKWIYTRMLGNAISLINSLSRAEEKPKTLTKCQNCSRRFFFLFSIKKLLTGLLFYFLFHLSNFSLISLYETHPLCFRVNSAKAKYQQRRYKNFCFISLCSIKMWCEWTMALQKSKTEKQNLRHGLNIELKAPFVSMRNFQQIQLAKCSGIFSVQRLWKYFHLTVGEGDKNGYLNLSTMRR